MNRCTLIGNLTRDPEVTTTGNGLSLCRFSIAINRSFKNANGEYDVDYLNITCWRGLAENCGKYLNKGSKVAVCGTIQTRTYEVEGQKRYATDIVADDVQFLSARSSAGGATSEYNAPVTAKKQVSDLTPIEDEGLPF